MSEAKNKLIQEALSGDIEAMKTYVLEVAPMDDDIANLKKNLKKERKSNSYRPDKVKHFKGNPKKDPALWKKRKRK